MNNSYWASFNESFRLWNWLLFFFYFLCIFSLKMKQKSTFLFIPTGKRLTCLSCAIKKKERWKYMLSEASSYTAPPFTAFLQKPAVLGEWPGRVSTSQTSDCQELNFSSFLCPVSPAVVLASHQTWETWVVPTTFKKHSTKCDFPYSMGR